MKNVLLLLKGPDPSDRALYKELIKVKRMDINNKLLLIIIYY